MNHEGTKNAKQEKERNAVLPSCSSRLRGSFKSLN